MTVPLKTYEDKTNFTNFRAEPQDNMRHEEAFNT